ncbi:type II secretion system F family protein [Clostridium sp. JNZ X4-2]
MPAIKKVNIIIKYQAINTSGKKIRGKCEKYKFSQLKTSLRKKQYFIYNKAYVKKYDDIFLKKPNMMDISILCSQLSIMLSAGISVSRALDDLEKQCSISSLKRELGIVKEEVEKGKNLHESMAEFKNTFPVFMVEMIKIGEECGRMDEIFKKLSEYYEKYYSIISSIKASLVYPVVTFIISIFVMLFLMIDIVPQFMNIIISNGGKVPVLTRIVIYGCQFFRVHCIQISAIFIFILLMFYEFHKSYSGIRILENIKIKIPYFNKIHNDVMIFKICSSMAILIKSGVNIIRSLKITSKLMENKIMSTKIEDSIKYIEGGESLYEAFSRTKINDELFLSLISTGEETGDMDSMFLKLEQLFEDKLDRCLKKMSKFVEPVIIIFLSLFVGVFIISALMPIFTIMDSTL